MPIHTYRTYKINALYTLLNGVEGMIKINGYGHWSLVIITTLLWSDWSELLGGCNNLGERSFKTLSEICEGYDQHGVTVSGVQADPLLRPSVKLHGQA